MPSLFGALDTAVTGLTAQSAAFSDISDNIANSQTTGFKRADTSFADYLSVSTATTNDSGSVVARPEYQNDDQGAITASSNPLALAISGQGFFQVSQETGTGATTSLSSQQEYSRDGNFTLNNNGYLVNDSNEVLDGWLADPTTGVLNETQQVPIVVSEAGSPPVATANVTLSANLPATPSAAVTSQIDVYDAKGTQHVVDLTYTQTAADTWTVSLNAPDATTPALGTAQIDFGSTVSNNPVAAGTIGSLTNATGTVTTTAYAAATPATINFTANFGSGAQTVGFQLGNFGTSTGLTQFAGTTYQANSLTQDGLSPGNYKSVTVETSGNVLINYDNGSSKTVAKVPVVQFAAPDALQRQNGQGFTATAQSGVALPQDLAGSGSAALVTGSIEGSNVDIATEFTQLIVAQQAYAANAKVVTTANDMLTTTIDMKR